jgi:AAA15 family ATPase/GTPase
METKHLSYFKIENFKNLKSVELSDIGFFNVIVGDNNVGKTSLLEALLFNPNAAIFNSNLGDTLLDRGLIPFSKSKGVTNFIDGFQPVHNYTSNFININSKEKSFSINFKTSSGKLNTQKVSVYKKKNPFELFDKYKNTASTIDDYVIECHFNYEPEEITTSEDSYNFLSDNTLFDDLVEFYEETVQKKYNLKKIFLQELKSLIPNISNIEIKNGKSEQQYPYLIYYTSDSDVPLPVNVLGQGSVKILKLLMGITYFNNHRLMIDEIDNGIHYKRQKDFIKQVVLAAKQSNTQIFCTTHSIECLKAIKEAFEMDELKAYQNEFRCFSLAKNKEDDIKAFKYDFESYQHNINFNNELR